MLNNAPTIQTSLVLDWSKNSNQLSTKNAKTQSRGSKCNRCLFFMYIFWAAFTSADSSSSSEPIFFSSFQLFLHIKYSVGGQKLAEEVKKKHQMKSINCAFNQQNKASFGHLLSFLHWRTQQGFKCFVGFDLVLPNYMN